jgi:Tfp pilus assembly protein PilE
MGFSLIEAAIVAAIVLILMAIGCVAYSDSIGKMTILQPMTSTVCVEYRRHAG